MAQNFLNVKIISPTQTIFEGKVLSISSVNSTGKFDILPFHANFITLVQKNPVILRVKKKGNEGKISKAFALDQFFERDVAEVKYDFDTAIIFTKDNFVKIYTNIQPQF
ncbi:hypothetical protein HYW44_03200 [Candidatus Daviesbacteria bacterium]|nr:hypothetical protein [Candidatus Daviesbacteria bacterium]